MATNDTPKNWTSMDVALFEADRANCRRGEHRGTALHSATR